VLPILPAVSIAGPASPLHSRQVRLPAGAGGELYHGDCLEVMRLLPGGSVDLAYADPPFASGRAYAARDGREAYADAWDGMDAYLAWLRPRLAEARRLLTPSGSLFVHCDWHAGHYVKVELDRLFGTSLATEGAGFKNEIVWSYGLGGSSARYLPRKHDTILWYANGPGHAFQAPLVPARSVRMRGQLKKLSDVWDIPSLNNMAAERTGYPTQKPEALVERLLRLASRRGDVVLDPFCGSGTVPAVARRLRRRFVACDASPLAVETTARRLRAG
jgi:DNA modification methylase